MSASRRFGHWLKIIIVQTNEQSDSYSSQERHYGFHDLGELSWSRGQSEWEGRILIQLDYPLETHECPVLCMDRNALVCILSIYFHHIVALEKGSFHH